MIKGNRRGWLQHQREVTVRGSRPAGFFISIGILFPAFPGDGLKLWPQKEYRTREQREEVAEKFITHLYEEYLSFSGSLEHMTGYSFPGYFRDQFFPIKSIRSTFRSAWIRLRTHWRNRWKYCIYALAPRGAARDHRVCGKGFQVDA